MSTSPRSGPHEGLAGRLVGLGRIEIGGLEVAIAAGLRARWLGLAHLDRERVGTGLLIARCTSIHTFGMRFALDVHFLDGALEPIAVVRDVGPRRIVSHRAAKAVLEVPAGGGEPSPGRA